MISRGPQGHYLHFTLIFFLNSYGPLKFDLIFGFFEGFVFVIPACVLVRMCFCQNQLIACRISMFLLKTTFYFLFIQKIYDRLQKGIHFLICDNTFCAHSTSVSVCKESLETWYNQRWARATFLGVRNRNSATWRKNFRNRNSATFKRMLLRNRNSAIPQLQFFLKSATSSQQPESFTSAISGIFWPRSSLKLYIFYRQVYFVIQRILKRKHHEIFGLSFFVNHSHMKII